jgi:serine/threonine protein kinase
MTIDGRYVIQAHVASGGMGEVFEAAHKVIKGRVAIKFLRPSLISNREILERFIREAKIASEMGGNVVARVHDFQVLKGIPYMVMEYLDGTPLDVLISEGRIFAPEEAARLIYPVCLALQKIHDRGIIHRDIKPANLILIDDEEGKYLKLLDFGISRFREIPDGKKLTDSGMVFGTAAYMSPEQAEGSYDVDHRSDLYSLAGVFYEMVTGHPPYDGKNYNEIIISIATKGHRDPRDYVPGMSVSVVDFIDTALAKDREDRFPSASAMAEALVGIIGGRPVADTTVPPGSSLAATQLHGAVRARRRRRKLIFWAPILTLALALLAFLAYYAASVKFRPPEKEAVGAIGKIPAVGVAGLKAGPDKSITDLSTAKPAPLELPAPVDEKKQKEKKHSGKKGRHSYYGKELD